MKSVAPTSVPARDFGRSPDDVDHLLRSFFQEEKPKSWPGFAGGSTPVGIAFHASPWPSRFVLAASITLLLLGTWWMGGRISGPETPTAPTGRGKVIGAKPRRDKAHAPSTIPERKQPEDAARHLQP